MKFFLLTMILLLSVHCFSQNAYYDALKLSKYLVNDSLTSDSSSKDEYSKILNSYLSSPHNTFDVQTIFNDYTNSKSQNYNPFLSGLFPVPKKGAAAGLRPPLKKGLSSALFSIGNLDVTNIADGLARFLIKRGKEELNIAFFQRMKDFLDEHVEAKTLFPATSKFLGGIASYRYSELLQSLREAFYKDISNLIVNLNQLIDLPKYQNLLKALPEIRVAIRSAKIISALSQPDSSMHPANLISHFAELKEWGEMNINLQSSWRALDEISKSVRRAQYTINTVYDTASLMTLKEASRILPGNSISDTVKLTSGYYTIRTKNFGSDTAIKFDTTFTPNITSRTDTVKNNVIAWIKYDDFNKDILSDSITLKIYLGLLYQKMGGIVFRDSKGDTASVQGFMEHYRDDIFKVADLIENFLVLANDVEQSVKDIREKKGKGFTNDDYYTYIEKAIDVVDYGFKVANTIKEGIADDRYIVMARNANNLFKNIYTKNYNAAVMNSYLILEEVFDNSKSAITDKDNFLTALKDPDNAISVLTVQRADFLADTINFENARHVLLEDSVFYSKKKANDRAKLVEDILKYGNVMASIIKAEGPEEAEAAIEAAVLPAGSSSIKKNSSWNISLNAYIGGYITNYTNASNKIDGNNSKVGVTAPVGIAFSKSLGHYKNGSPVGALSIYGTLIDVGAIAGYRLSNDSTALESKVTINDIFTPGGYLVYGLGLPFKWLSYVPLSVGYGWQYGSKLYYKTSNGTLTTSDKSRWRSNWFIAIDIPLANFWTKNYQKKK